MAETDQAHLARVERGERWPSIPLLFRLADALETDISLLFRSADQAAGDLRDDVWLVLKDASAGQQALAREMLRILRSSWRLEDPQAQGEPTQEPS
jgi:transcriptional regulator with XRE-family HTH domain